MVLHMLGGGEVPYGLCHFYMKDRLEVSINMKEDYDLTEHIVIIFVNAKEFVIVIVTLR